MVALFEIRGPQSWPLFAAGLINPLALIWLALRSSGKAPVARRCLAIAGVSLVTLSWYVLSQDLTVRVGHVTWVAGLLLMWGPDLVKMSGCGNRPQRRDAVR